MKAQRYTLTKREILRGYGAFSRTISLGRTIQRGPIRCFYRAGAEGGRGLRVGFSVTRNIRVAATRNRIRRWMKEAYRLHKGILLEPLPDRMGRFDIVFLFYMRAVPAINHHIRESIDQAVGPLLKELRPRCSDTP